MSLAYCSDCGEPARAHTTGGCPTGVSRVICTECPELRAENARLAQELKSAHEVLVDCGDQSQALAGRVERLEAALRDLVVNYYDYVGQTQGGVEAIQRARAALSEVLSEVGEP